MRRQVANTPGIPEAAPYGTFTDVAAEKAANRSLFWAGLLGGAALSVLAWAGDLVLVGAAERRRESERRAEAEAERREIAELAAARVLAALEERLPATPGRDAVATRRRPAGRVAGWRGWLRRLARRERFSGGRARLKGRLTLSHLDRTNLKRVTRVTGQSPRAMASGRANSQWSARNMMSIETSISLRDAEFHALASGADLLPIALTWEKPPFGGRTNA